MSQGHVINRCELAMGEWLDGKYRIEKLIGEGTFGKVYLVRDGKEDFYALKLLKLWEVDPEIRENLTSRFKMEFHTGSIDSPHLVHSYRYGFFNGNPYILMEYCPNGDLRQYFKHGGEEIMRIASHVLSGLKTLHVNGKVHRDLKPENVLFKSDNVAALTDFGISGDRNKRMTERNIFGRPKEMFGTYAYMAPEQLKRERGNATVLPTTDIFSFGVMMYQVLTGELPFGTLNTPTDLAVYQANAYGGRWNTSQLEYMVDKNSAWTKIIDGCLKADYKQRISSVDEILSFFSNGHSGEKGISNVSPSVATRSEKIVWRIMQGANCGNEYALRSLTGGNRHIITVGREADNTLTLPEAEDNYVSRYHCTIEASDDFSRWYIRDGQWRPEEKVWKHSLNGTFVNAHEVRQEGAQLHDGDIVSLGNVKIKVECK